MRRCGGRRGLALILDLLLVIAEYFLFNGNVYTGQTRIRPALGRQSLKKQILYPYPPWGIQLGQIT